MIYCIYTLSIKKRYVKITIQFCIIRITNTIIHINTARTPFIFNVTPRKVRCKIKRSPKMEEKSDLDRLSLLAKLASPSHRRSTPKHDSKRIISQDEPIIRCVCGKFGTSENFIQCCRCRCMSHVECINEDVDEEATDWICPFCKTASAEALIDAGIDLPTMHHVIRNSKASGHYDEVVQSAKKVAQEVYELQRAADWVQTLCARDDVYDTIIQATNACIDGDTEIEKELNEERAMLKDLSLLLNKMADESNQLKSPKLCCLLDQIKTHPL